MKTIGNTKPGTEAKAQSQGDAKKQTKPRKTKEK